MDDGRFYCNYHRHFFVVTDRLSVTLVTSTNTRLPKTGLPVTQHICCILLLFIEQVYCNETNTRPKTCNVLEVPNAAVVET